MGVCVEPLLGTRWSNTDTGTRSVEGRDLEREEGWHISCVRLLPPPTLLGTVRDTSLERE